MDGVNKTLYIPLYGKAFVSKRGLLLRDPKAEEIWAAQGFPLKGKAKSKWLAYNMGMRSAVFDRWLSEKLEAFPDAVVLHPGCGLDSRCHRVNHEGAWYDLDFPEVITERRRFFMETDRYRMIPADLREEGWLEAIPRGGTALIVMEGVSMYLTREELSALLSRWRAHFSQVCLLMDHYTTFAARATKYKNPINEVGVTTVHGFDDPLTVTQGTGFCPEKELSLTPDDLIAQLPKKEQKFFRTMFAGKMAKKIYRLYSYEAFPRGEGGPEGRMRDGDM